MNPAKIVNLLHRAGIQIRVRDGRRGEFLALVPADGATPEMIEFVGANKPVLLRHLREVAPRVLAALELGRRSQANETPLQHVDETKVSPSLREQVRTVEEVFLGTQLKGVREKEVVQHAMNSTEVEEPTTRRHGG